MFEAHNKALENKITLTKHNKWNGPYMYMNVPEDMYHKEVERGTWQKFRDKVYNKSMPGIKCTEGTQR
jgi:hypothetical protein